MKFEMCCMDCGSENLIKFVQLFKNDTKHYYVKCKDCGKQFYDPSRFITPDLEIRESRHRKKKRKHLISLFVDDFSI